MASDGDQDREWMGRALQLAEQGRGRVEPNPMVGCVLVRDGEVVTPPLAGGCLAGVTRALGLELCEREGISAAETDLPLEALRDAEEAFLTSTTRDVQPIRRVDSRELPLVPGEVTAKLRRAFRAMAEAEIDP